LVLTGISDQREIERYPFRPDEILGSVAELVRVEPFETELADGEEGLEAGL
jgi:NagD protein